MNMADISSWRYTTKHYDNTKKIPQEQIEQLYTVLQNTPSSVNLQPWHFVVVSTEEGRNKILPAVRDFNHARVVDSSHTIILCVRSELDDMHLKNLTDQEDKDGRYPTEKDKQAQDAGRHFFVNLNSSTVEHRLTWETNQLYIALGNLLFAAASMGIDSTAIEGFDKDKMDEILDLKSKGLKSIVMATLGYRKEDDSNAKRPKSRLPKETLFTFL